MATEKDDDLKMMEFWKVCGALSSTLSALEVGGNDGLRCLLMVAARAVIETSETKESGDDRERLCKFMGMAYDAAADIPKEMFSDLINAGAEEATRALAASFVDSGEAESFGQYL
jgi:hypothetical protein